MAKEHLFFHKKTGSITKATKSQAKFLPPGYQRIEFTKNQKGERVMRFKFDGATVDVSDNDNKKAVIDGNRKTG